MWGQETQWKEGNLCQGIRVQAPSHLQSRKGGILDADHLGRISHRTIGVYKWHLWGLIQWPELRGILISLLNTCHIDLVAALDVNDDRAGAVVGVRVHPLRLQSLSTSMLRKSSSYVTWAEMVSLRYLWDCTNKTAWASFWCECPLPAETQNLGSLHELLPLAMPVSYGGFVGPWWCVPSLKCLCLNVLQTQAIWLPFCVVIKSGQAWSWFTNTFLRTGGWESLDLAGYLLFWI